jgi:hypothetical protein
VIKNPGQMDTLLNDYQAQAEEAFAAG